MRKKFFIIAMVLALLMAVMTSCDHDITEGESDFQSIQNGAFSDVLPSSSEEAAPVIVRDRFVFKNGEYNLNAVYTYIDDGEKHPAVLLIAGSGPSDCDSTLGSLKPFADIADALAQKGICSLRVDKRTLNYGASFANGGIEEEYLDDCRAAISYLKNQPTVGEVYLLGHSLGGQIACILQSETENISGTICFNSSLRHLADIACDQYSVADAANEYRYRLYADMAKTATADTATGSYYYGAQDHYWASYNKYDFVYLVNNSQSPLLIINSTKDMQLFEPDIELWDSVLGGSANATIIIDDSINHLGYETDLSSPDALIQNPELPQKIIDAFAEFINRVE